MRANISNLPDGTPFNPLSPYYKGNIITVIGQRSVVMIISLREDGQGC